MVFNSYSENRVVPLVVRQEYGEFQDDFSSAFICYCSFLMEPLCEATVFLLTQRHGISFFYNLVMPPGKADGSNKRGKSAMQLSLFGAGEG